MPDRVRIEFRGVSLFVPRTEDKARNLGSVRVLMPLTSSSSPPQDARPHHAYLSVYKKSARVPYLVRPIFGVALRVEAKGEASRPEFPKLMNLKTLVGDPNVRVIASPLPRVDVAALVTVTGGKRWRTDHKSVTNWEWSKDSKEKFSEPHLAVIWDGPEADVTVWFGDSDSLTLSPGETAVVGHYDDPRDALTRKIGERLKKWPADGIHRDNDFAWLYSLLTDPDVKGVPLTRKKDMPKPGSDASPSEIRSPLTTTCFGGTWEPEE